MTVFLCGRSTYRAKENPNPYKHGNKLPHSPLLAPLSLTHCLRGCDKSKIPGIHYSWHPGFESKPTISEPATSFNSGIDPSCHNEMLSATLPNDEGGGRQFAFSAP